jgi:hypothetical protein
MFGERAMTGLAPDGCVPSTPTRLLDIAVTGQASLATGVHQRPAAIIFDRLRPVVSVLPEFGCHQQPSNQEKGENSSQQHCCQPK